MAESVYDKVVSSGGWPRINSRYKPKKIVLIVLPFVLFKFHGRLD